MRMDNRRPFLTKQLHEPPEGRGILDQVDFSGEGRQELPPDPCFLQMAAVLFGRCSSALSVPSARQTGDDHRVKTAAVVSDGGEQRILCRAAAIEPRDE